MTRSPVEGDGDDLIETLAIISTEEGMYHVSGQVREGGKKGE